MSQTNLQAREPPWNILDWQYAPTMLPRRRHSEETRITAEFRSVVRAGRRPGLPGAPTRPAVDQPSPLTKKPYPRIFVVLSCLVFGLLAAGVIGVVVAPNKITELGVPLGFTLWAVLAKAIDRYDQRQLNG